ncbi:MAG: hypothetical protein M3Y81_04495 [Chloroflexota bacterium]|nr:hypothetical protein [Chloroflexota bacterium]
MIQTLPLVLFIVMMELSIGSFFVLFVLDWRDEVKRGFLVSYAIIYLFLSGLTYLFQQNYANSDLLNTYANLDKAWTGYQAGTLLLFLLLMLPYNLFLIMDKRAGVDGRTDDTAARTSLVRLLHLVSGSLCVVAGAASLLVLGMIFRPLASFNLGGVFTVAGFFAGSLALGGVLTAMWLGHWYLVTPALSEKPLLFSTTLVLAAVLAEIALALAIGPATTVASAPVPAPTATVTTGNIVPVVTAATPVPGGQTRPDAPVVAPLSAGAIGWIRVLVGFAMPLILGGFAWKLIRDRSFQSATGMLYLVVVCVLAGEAMARGLFLLGL